MNMDYLVENIKLQNDDVIIVPYHVTNPDFELVVSMANDYDIAKYVGHGFPNPYDRECAENFYNYTKSAWKSGKEFTFAILNKDEEYMGNISIKIDDEDNKIRNIGYWIAKKYSGHGYVSSAVKLMISFCFEELAVRRIEAGVYEGNVASQKVLEKNGFVKEGVKRKSYLTREGIEMDSIIYGILRDDYKKHDKFATI